MKYLKDNIHNLKHFKFLINFSKQRDQANLRNNFQLHQIDNHIQMNILINIFKF